MKLSYAVLSILLGTFSITSCGEHTTTTQDTTQVEEVIKKAEFQDEKFADLRVLKYNVPGFEQLTLSQKKLAYYLSMAAVSGRDIIYAQNNKHNLKIRKTFEGIMKTYKGEKSGEDWAAFELYVKRFWFSNGIHHHYSEMKFKPEFSEEYFSDLLKNSEVTSLPLLEGQSVEILTQELTPILFDPEVVKKKVNKEKDTDLLLTSATNFYDDDITESEARAFYKKIEAEGGENPISFGLNSTLKRLKGGEPEYAYGFKDDKLYEALWCIGSEFHPSGLPGLHAPAIREIVKWLEKAAEVAENEPQKQSILLLIEYYKTGDLKKFDEYSLAWVKATEGSIDFINGFIEVYGDPIAYRGSYESVIFMEDKESSARMKVLAENAQWFEDNAPMDKKYKKEKVSGITYRVINVINEAGDAAPSTPIGINLPNSNWVREQGSKSVSLGNITESYEKATGTSTVDEFYQDEAVRRRIKEFSTLSAKMHTAMHEVLGHASGKILVKTPKETLKSYASTLEEARADLFGLYYIMDPKIIELGLIPSDEVAKAEYDTYITNGMFLQLNRLDEGAVIEEDHMRNRQLVAKWCFENGKAENVIEQKVVDGKTYFVINDYAKLRVLFGKLLAEIQRLSSVGDYEAGKKLVENYGVQVDAALWKEVKQRYSTLDVAPYSGFVQPELVPVMQGEEIIDVILQYPSTFTEQMLQYGDKFGFLPFN